MIDVNAETIEWTDLNLTLFPYIYLYHTRYGFWQQLIGPPSKHQRST